MRITFPLPQNQLDRDTLIVQSFSFRFWFVVTCGFPNIMSHRSLGIVTITFYSSTMEKKNYKKSIIRDVTR